MSDLLLLLLCVVVVVCCCVLHVFFVDNAREVKSLYNYYSITL
jgi:hypothetical protein